MRFVIRKAEVRASDEISFDDSILVRCNSFEELAKIAYERKLSGSDMPYEMAGIDDNGNVYRLQFDFGKLNNTKKKFEVNKNELIKKRKFIGDILVEMEIVKSGQIEKAFEEQRKHRYKKKLCDILVQLGYCSSEQILQALARQIGVDVQIMG